MFDITMTPKAANQVKNLLQKAPEGTDGVRLVITNTGCSGHSYKMEYVESGDDLSNDDVIESDGAKLYVPKIHTWMLIGMEIDYTTNALGNQAFVFNNPNAIGHCGCGESFQVSGDKPEI